MSRIFLNPGHAPGADPGAVNNDYGVTEAEVCRDIGKRLQEYLEESGHEIIVCQQDNLDCGYNSVIGKANDSDADIFVSIHCNSFVNSSACGTETYCYEKGGEGERLAYAIQFHLVNCLETVDRGVKTANFAVLRGTVMPAVLVETCFISNDRDVQYLLNENSRKSIARAIGRGIIDYIDYVN